MERAFKLNKESDYSKRLDQCKEYDKQQRDFIIKFFAEHGIESEYYKISGNGGVNCSFKERDKKDICLYISPTENDLKNFKNILCKPTQYGNKTMNRFKTNSNIGKELADGCVKEEIVINIHMPSPRDYFKELWCGYSYTQFEFDNKLYVKIDSKNLKGDELPEGFTEIKLSEFYKVMEEYDEKNK